MKPCPNCRADAVPDDGALCGACGYSLSATTAAPLASYVYVGPETAMDVRMRAALAREEGAAKAEPFPRIVVSIVMLDGTTAYMAKTREDDGAAPAEMGVTPQAARALLAVRLRRTAQELEREP